MSEIFTKKHANELDDNYPISSSGRKNMEAEEARSLTADILTNEQNTKRALYKIVVENGHLALGYKDFKSYVLAELPITPNAAGKQFAASVATAKIFGEEYIGVYSDAAMRFLSAFNLATQVMIIQYLQQKFNKQIQELPTPHELTTSAIKDAMNNISNSTKMLLRKSKEVIDPEDFDIESTNYLFESMALFEPYDEKEFVEKHGFSRWDERSINLFKKDELILFKSREDLHHELQYRWSLQAICQHVKTYFPEELDELVNEINRSGYPMELCIATLLEKYFPSINEQNSHDEVDEFGMNYQEDEEYYSVDEIMEATFFVDADSLQEEYVIELKYLKQQIAKKLNEELRFKNPKAGYLIALAEDMCLEELKLAQLFFELKYDEMAEEAEEAED